MAIELVMKSEQDQYSKLADYESGTVVRYGTKTNDYGIGVILKQPDDIETIIYDIKDNAYYSDHKKYVVRKVYKGAKFVVDED